MRRRLTNLYLNCDPSDAGEQVLFCFLNTHESFGNKEARPLPTFAHMHMMTNKLDATQWYIKAFEF